MTKATETATATPVIEFVSFVAPEKARKANEYDATVASLAQADADTAVQLTVETADAGKHEARFREAANHAGFGARKRSAEETEDGKTLLVFTLSTKRGSGKAAESATVDGEATESE